MAGLSDITQGLSGDPDDAVTILVDGKEFAYWSEFEIVSAMDEFSSLTFRAPFEPSNDEFKRIFKPFSFKKLELLIDGNTQFTGTIVGISPEADSSAGSVVVTGYALPGVMQECTLPSKHLPVELKDLGLQEILSAVSAPFGVESGVKGDAGARFDKVKLRKDQNVLDFIINLARQRNLIVNDTVDGQLLCYRPDNPGAPVADLEYGRPPVVTVSAEFNPQEYYSEITGFAATKRKTPGVSRTIQNAWLTEILRPSNFIASDTESQDLQSAVESKLGRMFANTCSYTIELSTWRDKEGELYTPGKLVSLLAPRVMVYNSYNFLIRSVKRKKSSSSKGCTLNVVLPGSFTGEHPESLPWDDSGFGIPGF